MWINRVLILLTYINYVDRHTDFVCQKNCPNFYTNLYTNVFYTFFLKYFISLKMSKNIFIPDSS